MRRVSFIDLFAGIGGIRLGFAAAAVELGIDAECVFSSEWDRFAQETYSANFGEIPHGDITEAATRAAIPASFDLLLAGFPCQPFSLAGVSKKNSLGRAHGFSDRTQGTLFHEIVHIVRRHEPAGFLLENVKHLANHDKGRTFRVIAEELDDLGYAWDHRIINASLRVPQNRERIYIIGYRRDLGIEPEFPEIDDSGPKVKQILHEHVDGGELPRHYWDRVPEALSRYTLSDHLWEYLQAYADKHRAKGNGFGFGLANVDGVTRTLSARYHKDGAEILIPQSRGRNPRRLTPRECARLQGFPDNFRIVCSDTQAYRQFGNSVAVPIIRELAMTMLPSLVAALEPKQLSLLAA